MVTLSTVFPRLWSIVRPRRRLSHRASGDAHPSSLGAALKMNRQVVLAEDLTSCIPGPLTNASKKQPRGTVGRSAAGRLGITPGIMTCIEATAMEVARSDADCNHPQKAFGCGRHHCADDDLSRRWLSIFVISFGRRAAWPRISIAALCCFCDVAVHIWLCPGPTTISAMPCSNHRQWTGWCLGG
jgi:hypothetical protein